MAHGDYRIEITLSVEAPQAELERSLLIAKVQPQIEALRQAMAEASGQPVTAEARSIRANIKQPRGPTGGPTRLAAAE